MNSIPDNSGLNQSGRKLPQTKERLSLKAYGLWRYIGEFPGASEGEIEAQFIDSRLLIRNALGELKRNDLIWSRNEIGGGSVVRLYFVKEGISYATCREFMRFWWGVFGGGGMSLGSGFELIDFPRTDRTSKLYLARVKHVVNAVSLDYALGFYLWHDHIGACQVCICDIHQTEITEDKFEFDRLKIIVDYIEKNKSLFGWALMALVDKSLIGHAIHINNYGKIPLEQKFADIWAMLDVRFDEARSAAEKRRADRK